MDLENSQPEPTPVTIPAIDLEPSLAISEAQPSPASDDTVVVTPQTSTEAPSNLTLSDALPIRPSNELRPTHVLVVDDNDINLKIMTTFMRKVGCTYDTATNGLIALEKYKASAQRFDFVLMG